MTAERSEAISASIHAAITASHGAVGVVERNPGAHLFDIGRRMEIVAFFVNPTQPCGERLADRGLAAARHAHQYQYRSHCADVDCSGMDFNIASCAITRGIASL